MLNPITYTEKVVSDFLKYQITTYPFADEDLYAQMRELLSLEHTRQTPLLQGPYISLSRGFQKGASMRELVQAGLLHPHLQQINPFPHVYGHQEQAIRSIAAKKTTLISTGTGSGKTECFLYPIISRCLQLRDQGQSSGIVAVIVYPMNALAEDQLTRLRDLLVGSGISFGMYVGKTPEKTEEAGGYRLPSGASKADYIAKCQELRKKDRSAVVHPPEERISREEMREQGRQPQILLTNVKQMELLLTRHKDVELFDHARLEYLVFDEAHTFKGAMGAETACLIRRLRAFCGRDVNDTVCIATSATIADPDLGPDAGKDFASRFFGVERDQVRLVQEAYESEIELWSTARKVSPAPDNPVEFLRAVLQAVDGNPVDVNRLNPYLQILSGQTLPETDWEAPLYELLGQNELIFQLVQSLQQPRPLGDLKQDLQQRVGRVVSEEELLSWLALGAAARREGRPFVRPVVHAFVRGVDGAVVTFAPATDRPRLWLSAQEAASDPESRQLHRFRVMTCKTCGQHYYVHSASDFQFTGDRPGGGTNEGGHVCWEAQEESLGGSRLVLVDHLITDNDDDDVSNLENLRTTAQLFLCRYCGALFSHTHHRCQKCSHENSLFPIYTVRQKEDQPGQLSRCISCGSAGRRYYGSFREPARPVRATTVSDVHVLAQNLVQHAERKRLLVFADNRQDVAFQAGWMGDRARRFRLRSLMYNIIKNAPISIGDLTAELDDLMENNDELSQSLLSEVWSMERKEAAGNKHRQERKYFLRIQVLREITTATKQRIGLEPWGRIRVDYQGLDPDHPFIHRWADEFGMPPNNLVDGIASILDFHRRDMLLLDRTGLIFSKIWQEGDREIGFGFLSLNQFQGVPKGIKLERHPNDAQSRIKQWLSTHPTFASAAVKNWCNEQLSDESKSEMVQAFLTELWDFLTSKDIGILGQVDLIGWQNRVLNGCDGAHQVDADRIIITPKPKGVYRCQTCQRRYARPMPHDKCIAWRCTGQLKHTDENPDDYDLMVLDEEFAMIRAAEHSAQVPGDLREKLEYQFKGEGDKINTLVCTPTLELGVDIGSLDAVLMRNVPPLPANYWQRAGRAGRRHRMALNMTYARPASHDRAYFKEPLKMLEGTIDAPRFYLSNQLMIEKHVHAVILTELHQLNRKGDGLTPYDQKQIGQVLQTCFPYLTTTYFFDEEQRLRSEPLDLSDFERLLSKHETRLLSRIREVFSQGWPESDMAVVTEGQLLHCIRQTAQELKTVIQILWQRLLWALEQINRLNTIRTQKGTLDPDEDVLWIRCDDYIKRMKGQKKRSGQSAEGFDETNTFGVLAAEGFLPGYGLDKGGVVGTARPARSLSGQREFVIRRPAAVALREFMPGNSIYANGQRFYPRFYMLEPKEATHFQVDVANEAVREVGVANSNGQNSLGTSQIRAVPICNTDLPHQSHISEDEDYRFQMPVSIFGYERDRHAGGHAYLWNRKQVTIRKSVHLRLVNVGAGQRVSIGELGYPICLVCGQSRSPFSTQADQDNFTHHHLDRCSHQVESTGFYADIIVDTLTIQACQDRTEAYSTAEALRIGASMVLDMDLEDLQILSIGQPGSQQVDTLIFDPMPGGSGLLEEVASRWPEIIQTARQVVEGCPSGCEHSCIDCLQSFRNAFYHRLLDRHRAAERLNEWGNQLQFSHAIPDKMPATESTRGGSAVNQAEETLRQMLTNAGFPEPYAQKEIDLGLPLGKTIPDLFYDDPMDRSEGICIYLDGMSKHIHGNPETQNRDRQIREYLRNEGYEVFEIPYGSLTYPDAMRQIFYQLGRLLLGKERAKAIRDNMI